MQVTLNFSYDQVVELARQLSPEEQEILLREIGKCRHARRNAIAAPLVTYHGLTEEEIEQKRQNLLRLALDCPVATDEEMVEIEENLNMFRKEFNESFARRLD